MNTVLYRLREFNNAFSLSAIAKLLWIEESLFRNRVAHCRTNLSIQEKVLVQERLDKQIKELVKIKVLLDKDIKW